MKKIIESRILVLIINLIVLIYSMSFSTHLIVFLYSSFYNSVSETFILHILSFYSQLILSVGVFLEFRTIIISNINLKNKSDVLNSLVHKNVDITNMGLITIGCLLNIILYSVLVINIFYVVWLLYVIVTIFAFLNINILYNNVYNNIKEITNKK